MTGGCVDENGLIRWGARRDFEEVTVPPGREDEADGEEDGDGDDEPEGDDD